MRLVRTALHAIIHVAMPKGQDPILMSCKQVTEILTNDDLELPKTQRLKLNLHLLVCQCCTDYKEQLEIISKTAKKIYPIELTARQKQKVLDLQNDILNRLK